PQMSPSLAVDVTTMAAVAVCCTLEQFCGKDPKIKWVNDIFLNDRKVCGILTEGVINGSTGQLDSLVLGIGINVTTPTEAFPEEVQLIAGSVFGNELPTVSRNQIAAGIINEVLQRSEYLGSHNHMDEYRERCFILGRKVTFLRDDVMHAGTALAISDDGGLVVELEQGGQIVLQSGEVSIRPV
ncbi:MAG: biotin--[Firmicutes bacterium]|nr:biotin--[acetyl-CoA-carboxylase] ligase [Bacillota bacterium]